MLRRKGVCGARGTLHFGLRIRQLRITQSRSADVIPLPSIVRPNAHGPDFGSRSGLTILVKSLIELSRHRGDPVRRGEGDFLPALKVLSVVPLLKRNGAIENKLPFIRVVVTFKLLHRQVEPFIRLESLERQIEYVTTATKWSVRGRSIIGFALFTITTIRT